MVTLEAELMLLGIWRNFDELEEHLTYDELVAMVKAVREREHRQMKWQAALKGVNLDEKNEEEDPVEKIKRKVRAKQAGMDEEEFSFREDVAEAGFKYKKI